MNDGEKVVDGFLSGTKGMGPDRALQTQVLIGIYAALRDIASSTEKLVQLKRRERSPKPNTGPR